MRAALRLLVVTSLAASVQGTVLHARAGTEHRVVTGNNLYVPGDAQFVPSPPLQIVEGDSLVHTNLDLERHDLVATTFRPDGLPWFDSPLVGQGEQASVPVEDVPPGLYPFTCSIHPFMAGRLQVVPRAAPVPEAGGDVEVQAKDDQTSVGYFQPKTLTVPAGTTVLWRNTGSQNHTVTASDGSWDSNPGCPMAGQACLTPGSTFSHTFLRPGAYPYYCKLHGTPAGGGHAGTISVVPPGSTPTSVGSLTANPSGSQVPVLGGAAFGGEAPITLAADPQGDPPGGGDTARQTGVDLIAAGVYTPDPAIPSLFFEWQVTNLPAGGSLPEMVRYTIPFRAGDKVFQVMAKFTDVVNPQRVGVGGSFAGDRVGRVFELRQCSAGAGPPTFCTHVAWLTGSFDVAAKTVRVKVPLGAATELVPGATLARNTTPPSDLVTIQAAYQAGVGVDALADQADFGTTTGFTYRIPAREVLLGIAPAGTPVGQVSFSTPATVGQDGSFSGSVASPGAGSWDVWARACFGTNCSTRSTRVTI